MAATHVCRDRVCRGLAAVAALALFCDVQTIGQQKDDGFRFRTGVDLVNVTVTVTDRDGRFVPNLRRDDFVVYEDGQPQPVAYFASERAPVSLGIAIDTSGSMAGEKIASAREALRRFLEDLLGPDDEIFVYRFSETPELVQEWTTDRGALRRQLGMLRPKGGTALYDTVAEAVPVAQSGQHRKKALVLISDGNDTNSTSTVEEVRQHIRMTEVLVYAVGIDGEQEPGVAWRQPQRPLPPIRLPFPFPGGGGRRGPWQTPPRIPLPLPSPRVGGPASNERVNVAALREMTDDSGGRTEVIRSARDLDPATAAIADELSRQYLIVYPAAARKDGRWHTIRVELRNRSYNVRSRRGYTAS
jgi:Ca-activated chloride channel homolog